jgi:hypothetical protein
MKSPVFIVPAAVLATATAVAILVAQVGARSDFRTELGSFSLMNAFRTRMNTAHYATGLLRKAISVIHRRG